MLIVCALPSVSIRAPANIPITLPAFAEIRRPDWINPPRSIPPIALKLTKSPAATVPFVKIFAPLMVTRSLEISDAPLAMSTSRSVPTATLDAPPDCALPAPIRRKPATA